jgi:hypothetical protein
MVQCVKFSRNLFHLHFTAPDARRPSPERERPNRDDATKVYGHHHPDFPKDRADTITRR